MFFSAWVTACSVLEVNSDTGFLGNVYQEASLQKVGIFNNAAQNKMNCYYKDNGKSNNKYLAFSILVPWTLWAGWLCGVSCALQNV